MPKNTYFLLFTNSSWKMKTVLSTQPISDTETDGISPKGCCPWAGNRATTKGSNHMHIEFSLLSRGRALADNGEL